MGIDSKVIETIKILYRLEKGALGKIYGPLQRYLGDNISRITLDDGKDYWHMWLDKYVKESVSNIKTD